MKYIHQRVKDDSRAETNNSRRREMWSKKGEEKESSAMFPHTAEELRRIKQPCRGNKTKSMRTLRSFRRCVAVVSMSIDGRKRERGSGRNKHRKKHKSEKQSTTQGLVFWGSSAPPKKIIRKKINMCEYRNFPPKREWILINKFLDFLSFFRVSLSFAACTHDSNSCSVFRSFGRF